MMYKGLLDKLPSSVSQYKAIISEENKELIADKVNEYVLEALSKEVSEVAANSKVDLMTFTKATETLSIKILSVPEYRVDIIALSGKNVLNTYTVEASNLEELEIRIKLIFIAMKEEYPDVENAYVLPYNHNDQVLKIIDNLKGMV